LKTLTLYLALFITACTTQQQKSVDKTLSSHNLDLSSPSKTYESCANGNINNAAKHIPLKSAKTYLSHCVTRKGKLHDIDKFVLSLSFLQIFGGMPQGDINRLDVIFDSYGGSANYEEERRFLTTTQIDNLYLELVAYFNQIGKLRGGVLVPKIEKFTVTGNYAKGVAASFKGSKQPPYEMAFKKIGGNWLIHVDEKRWKE